jgi:hypothetical protein
MLIPRFSEGFGNVDAKIAMDVLHKGKPTR